MPDDMILKLILSELEAKHWVMPNLSQASSTNSTSAGDSTSVSPSEEPSASFILDGFPRTASQAARLAPHLPINFVVSLITPPSIILDRIGKRWIHAPSGRVYNTDFNTPRTREKDDQTGEPLTKRPDDEASVWQKRLQKFQETSEPLLEFYQKQGVLWTVRGNSSDEISPQLFTQIEERFG